MASGEDPCPEHPERTRRNGFRYCFYIAHHGRGVSDDSQWAEDLGPDEEFAIFDEADWHDLSDPKGHLYGVRRSPDGMILDLGTEGEQIAKFWNPNDNQPTHGFPAWPLGDEVLANRRRTPAPKEAILRMEAVGLLLPEQRKKLLKGKQAR
jgi:hypothetical protein